MPQLAEIAPIYDLSRQTNRTRTGVHHKQYPLDTKLIQDWSGSPSELPNLREINPNESVCNPYPMSILLFQRIDICMQRAVPWIISFTVIYMIAQVLRVWWF